MRAALHRAARTGNPDRGRDLHDGRRHARHAAPRAGAHASRWCVDELAERAPRPPRLRADRRAQRTPLGGGTRVGPSELYGYDAHGSINFLTDGSGNVTDTYTYDGWGNLVAATGSTPNTRLYAGEEFDPDLGLINLRARQYRPSTGRFWTIDPAMGTLGQPTTLNRYLYAEGDPTDRLDSRGQASALEDALIATAVQTAVALVAEAIPHQSKWYSYCVIGGSVPGGFIGNYFAAVPGSLSVAVGFQLLAISSCALADVLTDPQRQP